MTLILTVNSRETIWLMADRRLSFGGQSCGDDARKIMILETNDAQAILGYAGLGETALGTEPADWMSRVLRGRNLSLEQSLDVLADAMNRELPRHLLMLPSRSPPAHSVLVSAFVDDKPRLYTIDLAFLPNRTSYNFRYTRHVVRSSPDCTPRVGIAGSGAQYLKVDREWFRPLLSIVKACDRKKITPYAVADHLAGVNLEASSHIRTVGPRCIVVWRNRKQGVRRGDGAHRCYFGDQRETSGAALPIIAAGADLGALTGVMMPHLMKRFKALRAGEPAPELDVDEINQELAQLPDTPDEELK